MICELFILNIYRVWNFLTWCVLEKFWKYWIMSGKWYISTRLPSPDPDGSEKRGNVQHVSHSTVPECADSLHIWVGQREFQDSDITATREIDTAVRRSLNSSHKYIIISKCYSEESYVVHKEDTVNCNAMWINQRKYSGLSMFRYFCIFSPSLPCIIRIPL